MIKSWANFLKLINDGISWTNDTVNFWRGCDKVSAACLHCYIYRVLRRFGQTAWGTVIRTTPHTWGKPERWEKFLAATTDGNTYMRMFTCSLSDFFHAKADKWRDEAWKVIKDSPHCAYLILTKRPERILKHLPKDWGNGYPNVWLGVSIGDNKSVYLADVLRKVPAAVRFLSLEPLLEDISEKLDITGIGWLFCGGESGEGDEYKWDSATMDWREMDGKTGHRTMDLGWAYRLYIKACDAHVPFFFKQITSAKSGEGADKLTGEKVHNWPAPPNGGAWWVKPKGFGAAEEGELVQIKEAE